MVSPPEEGGLKEAIDSYINIIIGDSTLCKILPPQLNNMNSPNKVMCICECFVSSKSMHSYLLTWRDRRLKHLKDRSQNAQNRRSGELSSHIFDPYNDLVQPHGCHIYITA